MSPERFAPATPRTGAPDALGAADLHFLATLLGQRSGMVVDESKEYLLASRLSPIVHEEQLGSLSELVTALRREPRGPLEAKVVEAMTINETSFFRDAHPFTALVEHVIPELLARRPAPARVTVWCGACSSGQEPYSVALALAEAAPDLVAAGRVRILATDLSPRMVARTAAGRFSQLEVNRGLPARLLVRHFTQDGRSWVIAPQLRSLVETRTLNLVEPWTRVPRCDVVFLRNVLIYFDLPTRRAVLERLRRDALAPGGYVFLGASETSARLDEGWCRRQFGRAVVFQAQ
jgi:chemotaxis protein methyltransferase CheR